MRIIALRGGDNCGKTATLNFVHTLVINAGGISTSKKKEGADPKDFSDIVNYKGMKVAFFTMGDYSYATINAINNYSSIKVNIVVLASNVKFKKPIKLIMRYPNNLINKTIAKPSTTATNLVANTADANTIYALI